jgi:hypothetical protein
VRSRILLLTLLCGVLAALASAAPASASPRMCVYVQERNVTGDSMTGHAFVQMLPDSGPDAGKRNLVYGFYPKVKARFLDGPGEVKDDADHGWDWKLCRFVTTDQYNKAAKVVADDRKTTPDYVFLKFNCTDWAYKVGKAADIPLPPAGAFITNVYDPERVAKEFQKMFQQQGGRNIPGGNAVFRNSDRKTAQQSSDYRVAGAAANLDAPFGDSYTDIVRTVVDDPKEVADMYDFSSDAASLDGVTLDTDGELHLRLNGFDADKAITGVRWGDGEADYQHHAFKHTYREAGTYHLTGFAIADYDVYRFRVPVRVEKGGDGEATVSVDVPNGTPKPDAAPVLHEAPPIAQLPAG